MIELLSNDERTFEAGQGGWVAWINTPARDATFRHSGTYSLKWTSTANATGIQLPSLVVPSGYAYVAFTGWCYASTERINNYVYLRCRDNATAVYDDTLALYIFGPQWRPFSAHHILGTRDRIDLYFYNTAALTGDNFWIDDLSVVVYNNPHTMKVWDGATWRPRSAKVWNGTEWI
jgi:hypothetical protein